LLLNLGNLIVFNELISSIDLVINSTVMLKLKNKKLSNLTVYIK